MPEADNQQTVGRLGAHQLTYFRFAPYRANAWDIPSLVLTALPNRAL